MKKKQYLCSGLRISDKIIFKRSHTMANIFKQLFRSNDIYQQVESFIINELTIRKDRCYEEAKAESTIKRQLIEKFGRENVDNQHSIGGTNGLKCDVDLFNGKCGIEIKIADQMENANNLQRALGQVMYYSHCYYKENDLILLVAGRESGLSARLKELKEIIDQIPRVHFIYKPAK